MPNEMAIHDPGQRAPSGARQHKGEIVIRGHNVMQGYYRRPDANADAFAHGWFRLATKVSTRWGADGNDYFFITGRIKELIIRGGVNYSTFEIDEATESHSGREGGVGGRIPGTSITAKRSGLHRAGRGRRAGAGCDHRCCCRNVALLQTAQSRRLRRRDSRHQHGEVSAVEAGPSVRGVARRSSFSGVSAVWG
ncbi:MAG: AMP-binding protein [Ardenticatenales bacterium]|nr:AMP-binding protein [Ardenticatenales bacterium]